ncbi:RNA polymerase sigma factor [Gracilimonas sp.]|uniref:RNA polymerase sigma factor n=1 Tax=Gracilimonas sp. TaxID=1974203 RepID=UPI0028727E62|nr:sigma-70 family RNA polymerase sigma factor [Gracilimonas sp.]
MINWFKRRSQSSNSYQTNEEWISALKPPPEDAAIQQLRNHLVKGLKASLYKYVDRELDNFVEDIAQDSVLKILDKYDTFRGESKFTTWAMKVAVREGYSELRKKRYNDISLEQYSSYNPDEKEAVEIEHEQAGPDQLTHESMVVQKVMKIMEEELTKKQQKVLQLLMIDQIPMTVVSEMMDSNRNAIYKLVHDARLKLKNRMEVEGMDPEEILNEM